MQQVITVINMTVASLLFLWASFDPNSIGP